MICFPIVSYLLITKTNWIIPEDNKPYLPYIDCQGRRNTSVFSVKNWEKLYITQPHFDIICLHIACNVSHWSHLDKILGKIYFSMGSEDVYIIFRNKMFAVFSSSLFPLFSPLLSLCSPSYRGFSLLDVFIARLSLLSEWSSGCDSHNGSDRVTHSSRLYTCG